VRTGPNQVETALMHVAELDSRVTDLRVGAIHRRNPLHTFMFNAEGVLLNANVAALEAFHQHHAGDCRIQLVQSPALAPMLAVNVGQACRPSQQAPSNADQLSSVSLDAAHICMGDAQSG